MADRIKILMTISDLSGGGGEREFANLLRFLDRKEFDVHVCLWRPVFTYPVPEGIPVTILNKTKPWHVVRTIRRLSCLIDDLRPAVVFSMLYYVNIVTGTALALTRHKPPWACRFNNPVEIDVRGMKKYWAGKVIPRADRLLGCSDGVCRSLINHFGLDSLKVQTIYNPLDIEAIERLAAEPLPFEKPGNRFVIAHSGRFSPQKNQKLLLQAFSKMKRNNGELWMLGDGKLEGELKKEASLLGIEEKIRWLGFQKNPFPFIRAADCFALSSSWEGLPTVIIEAMACGTPVVSTLCPYGPAELIEDGRTGLLVPVEDAEKLAEALDMLASDSALRTTIADNAAHEIKIKFSGQRSLSAHAALFKELGSGRYQRAKQPLKGA
ncbi:MAG: glycosyltransferase [Pseudomonadota bacterium]